VGVATAQKSRLQTTPGYNSIAILKKPTRKKTRSLLLKKKKTKRRPTKQTTSSPPPLGHSLPHSSDHSHQPVVTLHHIPHRLHLPLPPPCRPQIDQLGPAEMSREATIVRRLFLQRNAEVVLVAIGGRVSISSAPSLPQQRGSHFRLFEPSWKRGQRQRALEVVDSGGSGASSLLVPFRRLGESPEIALVEEVERVLSASRKCDGGDLGAVSLLIFC
jgi:hypothetical protein